MKNRIAACLTTMASLLFAVGWIQASHASSADKAAPAEAVAIFAGGCFWCVESDFDHVPGVTRTISGYIGGTTDNPTYRDVTGGGTGHREAVQIFYDPAKVDYKTLLDVFWRSVDPTDDGGQFCDRGHSYKTAIFVASAQERQLAEASKQSVDASGILEKPVVTTIEDAGVFYPAEVYHQDYYKKSPLRYKLYRMSCGRDGRIEDLWGDQAHQGIEKH